MRLKCLYVAFIFLILLNSCVKNNKQSKNQLHNNLPYALEIYDSIVVNNYMGAWLITDVNSKYILGFDIKTNDVVLINLGTDQVHTLNHTGNGPYEYGRIKGLSFFNDSSIVLMDNKRVLFYNLHGKGRNYFNINDLIGMVGWNFQFNVPTFLKGNDSCIVARHYNYNFESGNLDKVKWLSCINLSIGKSSKHIPFRQGNFLINNPAKTFPDIVPLYVVARNKKELAIKYPYDVFIEKYTLPDLKFKTKINLGVDYFNAVPRMRRSENQEKVFTNEQVNSNFVGLFSGVDGIITEYKTGIPNNKIVKTRAELIQDNINETYRDYYAICIFNTDSVSNNIKLSWNGKKLDIAAVESMDKVYFYKRGLSVKEENTLVLYIGKFFRIETKMN